ncbi:MAG TPA: hypothetical protein VEL47_08100 [Myxococcota bacterium]|nr:hypothetical protein [Myxococcota bacterium]
MKLKVAIFLSTIMALSTSSWAANTFTKALIITIDQKTLSDGMNKAWDHARLDYIFAKAKTKYDGVYPVTGELVRNDEYMELIWHAALHKHDVVDYVSFVHEEDQWIKPEWKVAKNSNKLRMVYSEACHGGNGLKHFIQEYGAFVSAGHTDESPHLSASPFFSFVFLMSWLDGESFYQSLRNAEATGSNALNDPRYFGIARVFGKYTDVSQAIDGSRIKYAYRGDVSVLDFNINSPREEIWTDGLEYVEATITNDGTIAPGKVRLEILQEVFSKIAPQLGLMGIKF